MISSSMRSAELNFESVSVAPLDSVFARLRRLGDLAGRNGHMLDRPLLEELLTAAAEAEQEIIDQRARIRYLESLSITDELTGLLNRRGFHGELERALDRAVRLGECGLLVICDLDHFKAINDSYGHPAGDAVLCAVGQALRANTRRSDYVARLGGDEFVVLMTGCGKADAERLVAKLEAQVNQLLVTWGGHSIPVSATFGFERYDPQTCRDHLLVRADRNLYRRKQPHIWAAAQSDW